MRKIVRLLAVAMCLFSVTALGETVTGTATVPTVCGLDLSNYDVTIALDSTSSPVFFEVDNNTGNAAVITVDSIVPTGNTAAGSPLTGSQFYVEVNAEDLVANDSTTTLGNGNLTNQQIGIATALKASQLESGALGVVATITLTCP